MRFFNIALWTLDFGLHVWTLANVIKLTFFFKADTFPLIHFNLTMGNAQIQATWKQALHPSEIKNSVSSSLVFWTPDLKQSHVEAGAYAIKVSAFTFWVGLLLAVLNTLFMLFYGFFSVTYIINAALQLLGVYWICWIVAQKEGICCGTNKDWALVNAIIQVIYAIQFVINVIDLFQFFSTSFWYILVAATYIPYVWLQISVSFYSVKFYQFLSVAAAGASPGAASV